MIVVILCSHLATAGHASPVPQKTRVVCVSSVVRIDTSWSWPRYPRHVQRLVRISKRDYCPDHRYLPQIPTNHVGILKIPSAHKRRSRGILELLGDGAVKQGIFGHVHNSHSSAPKFFQNLMMGDRFTNRHDIS